MGLSFRGMTLVERLFATSFNTLQRFAFVRRGRSWVPSPLAGEGQGEGKSSGNESTHPNEKCCKEGKFWLAEVPIFAAMTQGRTYKEALAMIADWFATLINRPGFSVTVYEGKKGEFELS